jgi:hypothetical protein
MEGVEMSSRLAEQKRVLVELVNGSAWMVAALATVHDSGLPQAWIGAGVLRDLVWSERNGTGFNPADIHDVDVAFYDDADLTRNGDDRATDLLHRLHPDVPWEAKNQAAVHLWYHQRFGGDPVPALGSIRDAVATWPKTATCVAVRLATNGRVEVCAPFGLVDLLGGVWRRNPARITVAVSQVRLSRLHPQSRWHGVRAIPPDAPDQHGT